MNLPRFLEDKIKKSLKVHPVVLVCGPRQAGKTTLCQELVREDGFTYISLDDLRFLSAASHDPLAFLGGQPKPLILDEVQRVPEIFLTIKQDVDQNRQPGRYLLTGSANPLLLPKVADSLAGRMDVLRLYPFSQGEMRRGYETFLERAFSGEFTSSLKDEHLEELILRGGYPPVQSLEDEESRESWFHGYFETLMQKDVRDLARIENLSQIPRLVQLLATRVGGLVNFSELSRSLGIANATLHRYISFLQALFVIDFLPSWSRNIGKRLVKSPKLYFLDTGFLAYLLGIDTVSYQAENRGHLLENFVSVELWKQASWTRPLLQLFHFRSQTQQEVDFVLERCDGKLVGIEVKSTLTVKSDSFQGLRYLRKVAGESFQRGIVLYPGKEVIHFEKDLVAVPMTALWQ